MDTQQTNQQVIESLRQVVADSYALLAQTHMCHWNVRGSGFFALHQAFEAQYTELFQGIDEVAERLRSLGALAPGGLERLAGMAGMHELQEDATAEEMVKHLAECNAHVVKNAALARDRAGEAEDTGTEDLMISRIQTHEKTIWMLRSFLNG
ncbi:MAG: Dps family protein [Planctomycetota bacterium]